MAPMSDDSRSGETYRLRGERGKMFMPEQTALLVIAPIGQQIIARVSRNVSRTADHLVRRDGTLRPDTPSDQHKRQSSWTGWTPGFGLLIPRCWVRDPGGPPEKVLVRRGSRERPHPVRAAGARPGAGGERGPRALDAPRLPPRRRDQIAPALGSRCAAKATASPPARGCGVASRIGGPLSGKSTR